MKTTIGTSNVSVKATRTSQRARIRPPRGLVCPNCGGRKFDTVSTRPKDGVIVRKKKCLACGKRVLSREKLQ